MSSPSCPTDNELGRRVAVPPSQAEKVKLRGIHFSSVCLNKIVHLNESTPAKNPFECKIYI